MSTYVNRTQREIQMTARMLLSLLVLSVLSATAARVQQQPGTGRNNSASSMSKLRSLLRKEQRTQPAAVNFESETASRLVSGVADSRFRPPVTFCDFESHCPWNGSADGFSVRTAADIASLRKVARGSLSGPDADADGNRGGHFMYVGGKSLIDEKHHMQLNSQWLLRTQNKQCFLKFMFHAANISGSMLTIYAQTEGSVVHISNISNVSNNSWVPIKQHIGLRKNPFYIVIEVWVDDKFPFHAAFDNISLDTCFQDKYKECSEASFDCDPGVCIEKNRVCDITRDCPNGADEDSRCDHLRIWKASCDFENDTCGWENSSNDDLEWVRTDGHSGSANKFNIINDHTFGNASGHFLSFNTSEKTTFGHRAVITSAIFTPPPRSHRNVNSPHYNSCQVRFYYYMSGPHVGQLILETVELRPISRDRYQEHATVVFTNFGKKGADWHRESLALPNQTHRYRLRFTATANTRAIGNVAIDDISLSQACLVGTSSNDTIILPEPSGGFHPPNEPIGSIMNNVSRVYKFTTCGNEGRLGPSKHQCQLHYGNETTVDVAENGTLAGIQQWTVPETGVYSVIAGGAGGGLGMNNKRPSYGATARAVFNWSQGEVIYILVGQMGIGPCYQNCTDRLSKTKRGLSDLIVALSEDRSKKAIGGGGGGGATYVFKIDSSGQYIPLLVAAGGGGLATSMREGLSIPDGNGEHPKNHPANGKNANIGAGGGGGWRGTRRGATADVGGSSLLEGAVGGRTCNKSIEGKAVGGFGGGGGPCRSGGGGGGYVGGDAGENGTDIDNGNGGYSFVSGFYAHAAAADSVGAGSVTIYPSMVGCNCHYLCVILEVRSANYTCICPEGYRLDEDKQNCVEFSFTAQIGDVHVFAMKHLLFIIPVTVIILIAISTVMFFLYQRYRRQMAQTTRQEFVNNPELQLNRLRQQAAGGMVTEYNPNYEFGGSICTLQDLCHISRENLTLVKNLGQGAFGEVYQGYLSNIPGELRDVPVAIKTLPELSAAQADKDFLMEALIMSKFHHPNIVKFIGVCFEKLPKFIVLELLPGGDLKNFLRDCRPKPDKPPTLIMRDLLTLAVDVAKGCLYLEENHFIHRDIAARNCLLTTKDVTRVVKIADFGMARDIYRADYYRKGGKAMLPVKWMPPEAFLDGIFTSKTDVWSFGVLLWEVMSLGYMPYPGRGNQDVMQLVTSGGRLEPPSNCPMPIYQIMSQCWSPIPDDRPNFRTILERLGYCLQDPDVTKACLPVFHRPPSAERDATVMRPTDGDSVCLQVQRMGGDNEPTSPASTDYLIPIPSSSYSLCTEKTELPSAASSMESVDHLLELDDVGGGAGKSDATSPQTATGMKPIMPAANSNNRPAGNWETSFMQSTPKMAAAVAAPGGGSLPRQVAPMWSGGGPAYHSVPTQEEDLPPPPPSPPQPLSAMAYPPSSGTLPLATIPPPESSPARKSPPSAIARQRPSAKKLGQATTASGGLEKLPSFPENDGAGDSGSAPAPQPLDASSLPKQHPAQVMPYANVDVASGGAVSGSAGYDGGALGARTTNYGSGQTGAPLVHNEPYTITAPRGAAPPSNKGKYDKDAKC